MWKIDVIEIWPSGLQSAEEGIRWDILYDILSLTFLQRFSWCPWKIWHEEVERALRAAREQAATCDASRVIKWLICELLGDAPLKCDK